MEHTKAQKTELARLWEFAMMKNPLVAGSLVLLAMASVISFVPRLQRHPPRAVMPT